MQQRGNFPQQMQGPSSADRYLARAQQALNQPGLQDLEPPSGGMGDMPRPSDGPPPGQPVPNGPEDRFSLDERLSTGGGLPDGLDYVSQLRQKVAAEKAAGEAAESASAARKAGLKPDIPKGEMKLGRQGQSKSGHSVHQLANAENFPEIHAAAKAWLERNPDKRLKGPMMQTIAAAEDVKISDAQARRLAQRIMRASEEVKESRDYAGAGAKLVLGQK